MDLYELKKSISNDTIYPYYIMYGPEYIVRKIYIDKIAKVKGLTISYPNSFLEIIKSINRKSLIGNDMLYVIFNDMDIIKNEKAWEALKGIRGNNKIILCFENIDERTRFYKTFSDRIIKFDTLSQEILLKYISRDYGLSKETGLKLINRCDSDYGRISKIGEKINILSVADNISKEDAYRKLLKESQIPIAADKLEFEFVDCVMSGDIEYSLKLLKIMENDYSGLGLISLLYRNFRGLLLVQSCESKSNEDISKRTGVDKWLVSRLKDYCGVYKTSRLVKSLGFLQECDTGVKTGLLTDKESIYHFLCNLLYM